MTGAVSDRESVLQALDRLDDYALMRRDPPSDEDLARISRSLRAASAWLEARDFCEMIDRQGRPRSKDMTTKQKPVSELIKKELEDVSYSEWQRIVVRMRALERTVEWYAGQQDLGERARSTLEAGIFGDED